MRNDSFKTGYEFTPTQKDKNGSSSSNFPSRSGLGSRNTVVIMPTPTNLLKCMKDFEALRVTIENRSKKLLQSYSWDANQDIRIRVFWGLCNLIRSYDLGLYYAAHYTLDINWIQKVMPPVSKSDAGIVGKQFEVFIRYGFIFSLSSVVESAMRSILRAIDPGNKANKEFSGVWPCLFQHLSLSEPHVFREALKMLSAIRNCIHNNGVFFPRNEKDLEVPLPYRGRTYLFKQGQPHNYASNEQLIQITEDIFKMFEFIVTHRRVEAEVLIKDIATQASFFVI